ncbi:hypothetical protein [Aquibium sp. ELW1220]|uniref:hypothetical protein n=1 Tax=Aquibium sp. ELW1220 TaxID=2976766 RepID=UPI0025B0A8F2|nr:hypothetical protein [Aquibium sp. ELW1220]MDN2580731.1 hypothetical protein [Aquibium sp. ELW1220]
MSLAMNRSVDDAETEFLESMRPYYEGLGYHFKVHPLRTEVPGFLASHLPDAVASKEDGGIVVKLVSLLPRTLQPSVVELRNLIKERPEWQLTVAHMGGDPSGKHEMPVVGKDPILLRADEAEQLAADGHVAAAFVLGWSLLEATLNSLHPSADKRPRTPGTVVQTLSMNGDISYEMEKVLRPLIDLRNRVVHGDLDAMPSLDDVDQVLTAVRTALTEPAVDAAS